MPFKQTLAALRYRDFRLMWASSATEHLGEWMELATLLWLANELTQSPLWLMAVGFCRFVPLCFFSIIGGVVADRSDRRRLLILSLLGATLVSISLLVITYAELITIWHIIIFSLLSGIVTSFNHPARQSIMPNIVGREHLMNAISLDMIGITGSRLAAMPIAGYVIATSGAAPVFGLRACGTLLAIVCVFFMQVPPTPTQLTPQKPWHDLTAGFFYMCEERIVLGLVTLMTIPIFCAQVYTNLLPIFASDILQVGAVGYGYLQGAPGLGGLLGLILLLSLSNSRHKGLWLLTCGVAMGIALLIFSISHWFILSLVLLAFLGASYSVFLSVDATLIQTIIPDDKRGRVMSTREIARGLGPFAALLAGAMAQYVGVTLTTGLMGGLCTVIMIALVFGGKKIRDLE